MVYRRRVFPRGLIQVSTSRCHCLHRMLTIPFSPFTANIYLPAIPTIANAFHRSIEDINLTVTVYMVFQGVCM